MKKYAIIEHCGQEFLFEDSVASYALPFIRDELKRGEYHSQGLIFQPGDVVVDIGAHVGVISTILGKFNPEIRIFAYEPLPQNYKALRKNLKRNGVTNVTAFNKGVSADGLPIEIGLCDFNTGGTSQFYDPSRTSKVEKVETVTWSQILEENGIEKVKLLKIDCEGAEHQILPAIDLTQVSFLTGEFHLNKKLRQDGYSYAKLYDMLNKARVNFKVGEMEMLG